jgi:NAD-reducing hydrogenase large subunit
MRGYYQDNRDLFAHFASFPSNYLGLVKPDDSLEMYDGMLRMVGPEGEPLEEQWDTRDYLGLIGEVTEDWSYLKFPFYRAQGYPEGFYRVGPLARLNVARSVSTERAAAAWKEFRGATDGKPVEGSLFFHWARLVEIIYSLERAEVLLDDPEITGTDLLATSNEVLPEGIGVIEAPRGTLIHHYRAQPDGSIESANFIVATGHNNLAMNRAVREVADAFVDGNRLEEGMLNRVEAAIRCYDPCLSCSTHAIGAMPMVVELVDERNRMLDRCVRGVR